MANNSKEEILLKILTKVAELKKQEISKPKKIEKQAAPAEAAAKGIGLLGKLLLGGGLMGAGALGYKALSPTLADLSDTFDAVMNNDWRTYYYRKRMRDLLRNQSYNMNTMAQGLNSLRKDMFYQARADAANTLAPFGYRVVSNKQYNKLNNRFKNDRDFSAFF